MSAISPIARLQLGNADCNQPGCNQRFSSGNGTAASFYQAATRLSSGKRVSTSVYQAVTRLNTRYQATTEQPPAISKLYPGCNQHCQAATGLQPAFPNYAELPGEFHASKPKPGRNQRLPSYNLAATSVHQAVTEPQPAFTKL